MLISDSTDGSDADYKILIVSIIHASQISKSKGKMMIKSMQAKIAKDNTFCCFQHSLTDKCEAVI